MDFPLWPLLDFLSLYPLSDKPLPRRRHYPFGFNLSKSECLLQVAHSKSLIVFYWVLCVMCPFLNQSLWPEDCSVLIGQAGSHDHLRVWGQLTPCKSLGLWVDQKMVPHRVWKPEEDWMMWCHKSSTDVSWGQGKSKCPGLIKYHPWKTYLTFCILFLRAVKNCLWAVALLNISFISIPRVPLTSYTPLHPSAVSQRSTSFSRYHSPCILIDQQCWAAYQYGIPC